MGRQLDDGTLVLDDYKVLVITTHPEYWTRKMFFAVREWVRERGGKLMYLGGNGVNCEVRAWRPFAAGVSSRPHLSVAARGRSRISRTTGSSTTTAQARQ